MRQFQRYRQVIVDCYLSVQNYNARFARASKILCEIDLAPEVKHYIFHFIHL